MTQALIFDSTIGVQSGTLTLNRNIVVDSYVGDRSAGLVAGNISHIVLTENLFDHNGWSENPASWIVS